MGLPIGRFSPAPGIWVDRTDRSIRITGTMEAYGSQATAAIAATIQQTINSTWTQNFPDGYSIACNVTVNYRGPGTSASANAAQIEIVNMSGPSNVNNLPGMGRKMTLNASAQNVFTWVAAHEFGHVIGLDDRYSESIFSSIGGHFGCQRTTTVQAGYETNMMGVHRGALSGQNVADIASENEPSPYWMNDDDQVRNWINAHPAADIARLSTSHKLTAIRTLMGGWISDADMAAIGKICSSVNNRTEANAIRNGINLLDFTSIGQRTQMRVFFSQMPN
jgi:hypothetical protein